MKYGKHAEGIRPGRVLPYPALEPFIVQAPTVLGDRGSTRSESCHPAGRGTSGAHRRHKTRAPATKPADASSLPVHPERRTVGNRTGTSFRSITRRHQWAGGLVHRNDTGRSDPPPPASCSLGREARCYRNRNTHHVGLSCHSPLGACPPASRKRGSLPHISITRHLRSNAFEGGSIRQTEIAQPEF